MSGALGGDGIFDFAVGGPLFAPMWGRWRGKEEPSVVDEDAVVRVTSSDRLELTEHRALIGSPSRIAAAPVTVKPIERWLLGVDQRWQDLA
jgi:hypothetical protein